MLTPGAYVVKGVILDSSHKIKYRMEGTIPSIHLINPYSSIPFV